MKVKDKQHWIDIIAGSAILAVITGGFILLAAYHEPIRCAVRDWFGLVC